MRSSRLPNSFFGALPVLLPLLFAACAGSPPPEPDRRKIQSPDGKWLEQRIVRHPSRRPQEIFYVYRDPSGNFIRHGSDTHYFADGQVKLEEHYRDGALDSVTETWYPNGTKEGELPFREGKPHGKATTWYPDGMKKSEKSWSRGRLDGPAVEWDHKGQKRKEVLWKENKIDSVLVDR